MSNTYRDKLSARKKRGKPAQEKRRERMIKAKMASSCSVCGTPARHSELRNGICKRCYERMGITED